MNTHLLSKSSFLMGLQCDKQLYLHKNHYDLKDPIDAATQAIFNKGWEIGDYARKLFPGGIDVSPDSPFEYDKSVVQTEEALLAGRKVIYEAAFQYDDVLVANDILVNDNGKLKAHEVKSSTDIKDIHILDAAIQYYVITGAGIKLSDFFLIYINNQYTRNGSIDINSLFTIRSVYKEIKKLQPVIRDEVVRLKKVLKNDEVMNMDINENCKSPYECAFWGYCWDKIPEESVFEITSLATDKKFELYRNGIISIKDVPENFRLSERQQIQVDCHKQCCTYLNQDAVTEFLNSLKYPLYFMDFETFNPAIPLFENTRPYQVIPFQYSLHYQQRRFMEPEHRQFLAEAKTDPRSSFIQNLLKAVKGRGDIIVYNAAFEITRINELANDFPEYKDELLALIPRIKDLMEIFKRKDYYMPEFRGRYSIKKVLPALIPEMNYNHLGIADGGTASLAFEALQNEEDEIKIKSIRENLLQYCQLDTYAMVKILEKLYTIV